MEKLLKIVAISAFVVFVAASAVQDNSVKFGYLNSQAILAEMPEVKEADANLETLQKQLQKKGEKMVQDFQAKYQELARKEQAGELSPKQGEEQAKALEAEQKKIAQFEQEMISQVQGKRGELLQPIIERVDQAIQDIGKEGGYKLIFEAGGLLYAEEGQDISTMVKSKLGI